MPDLLLSSVEYGSYISITKFIIFLILFFLWLPLLNWVYRDAKIVGTKEVYWTSIVFSAGAAASIIWLMVPVFIVGMLFYLIAVGAASIGYVMHRNAKVPDFERVMTVEHIKGLFVNESKQLEALKDFLFVTANNNEVPMPGSKTQDFFGYKAAHDIFTDAIWRRVSDIVFTPTQRSYDVTYYIDGAKSKQPSVARDKMDYFIRFLKNIADLDADEKRKPQKGHFVTIQGKKKRVDWKVVTAGSTVGEQIEVKQTTRLDITKLTDIGLPSELCERINKISQFRQGLFIVAGRPKTGVTTTFYALLRNHDAFLNTISTLETKPSVDLPNITQNIFRLSDTNATTYAKKLQAVIEYGPSVIGVANCEDSETARVACEAVKDGKIVYVTLQADNVIQALGKWMKLVGDRALAVETLLGITNQRLLRKLCSECKQAYEPNKELLRKFNIPAEKTKVLYRDGKGQIDKRGGKTVTCESCQGTGFVGRVCVFEAITMNDVLREAVIQSKSLSEISTQFRRAKMLYLQEQALKKVVDGTTAINEMVRVFTSTKKKKIKETKQSK